MARAPEVVEGSTDTRPAACIVTPVTGAGRPREVVAGATLQPDVARRRPTGARVQPGRSRRGGQKGAAGREAKGSDVHATGGVIVGRRCGGRAERAGSRGAGPEGPPGSLPPKPPTPFPSSLFRQEPTRGGTTGSWSCLKGTGVGTGASRAAPREKRHHQGHVRWGRRRPCRPA